MDYKKYNDFELIYNVRENDDDSYDKLFNKYLPIMKNIAYMFYNNYRYYGYDLEDFQQEAYIAFCNAINCFDEKKDTLFYTFVVLCINRSLITFSRKISCDKKNINLNNVLNIDDINFIGNSNIEEFCSYDELISLCKNIICNLEFEDSCIFELRCNGFLYREISELLDIPLKRVQFKGRKFKNLFVDI